MWIETSFSIGESKWIIDQYSKRKWDYAIERLKY